MNQKCHAGSRHVCEPMASLSSSTLRQPYWPLTRQTAATHSEVGTAIRAIDRIRLRRRSLRSRCRRRWKRAKLAPATPSRTCAPPSSVNRLVWLPTIRTIAAARRKIPVSSRTQPDRACAGRATRRGRRSCGPASRRAAVRAGVRGAAASSTYDSESPPRPANVSDGVTPAADGGRRRRARSASRWSRPRDRRRRAPRAGRRRPGRPCRSASRGTATTGTTVTACSGRPVAAVAMAATSSIATGSGSPASATTSRVRVGGLGAGDLVVAEGQQRLDPVEVDPLAEELGEARAAAHDLEQPGVVLPGQVAGAQLAELGAEREVGHAVGVAHHHVRAGVDELADAVGVPPSTGSMRSAPPGIAIADRRRMGRGRARGGR